MHVTEREKPRDLEREGGRDSRSTADLQGREGVLDGTAWRTPVALRLSKPAESTTQALRASEGHDVSLWARASPRMHHLAREAGHGGGCSRAAGLAHSRSCHSVFAVNLRPPGKIKLRLKRTHYYVNLKTKV